MSIHFSCDKCGKGFKVKSELAGRHARCSECGTVLTVPSASTTPASAPVAGSVHSAHETAPAAMATAVVTQGEPAGNPSARGRLPLLLTVGGVGIAVVMAAVLFPIWKKPAGPSAPGVSRGQQVDQSVSRPAPTMGGELPSAVTRASADSATSMTTTKAVSQEQAPSKVESNQDKGIVILTGHKKNVTCAAFGADSRHIITGSEDNTVRVWDASAGVEVSKFEGHASSIRRLALSADGQYAISGDVGGTAFVWDIKSGRQLGKVVLGGMVDAVAFSPAGPQALIGGQVKQIMLWDVATSSLRRTLEVDGRVSGLAFTPNGKSVIVFREHNYNSPGGAKEDELIRFDLETGNKKILLRQSDEKNSYTGFDTIAMSPDGQTVAVGLRSGEIQVVSLESPDKVVMIPVPPSFAEAAKQLRSTPGDGRTLFSADFKSVYRSFAGFTTDRPGPDGWAKTHNWRRHGIFKYPGMDKIADIADEEPLEVMLALSPDGSHAAFKQNTGSAFHVKECISPRILQFEKK